MSDNNENTVDVKRKEKKRDKSEKTQRRFFKGIMKLIIWVCVIAVLVFLTLFLSSRIAEFDSIRDMIIWIRGQF